MGDSGMHKITQTVFLLAIVVYTATGIAAEHRSPLPIDSQEFTDKDFEKFFGLLEDGKITAEKNAQRCATEELGFTYTGAGLEHPPEATRTPMLDALVAAPWTSLEHRACAVALRRQ